jgi:hypothetical protein
MFQPDRLFRVLFPRWGFAFGFVIPPGRTRFSLGEKLDLVQGGLSCMYAEGAYAYPFHLSFDLGQWGRAKSRPRLQL